MKTVNQLNITSKVVVPTNSILYLQSASNYTLVFTYDKEFLFSKTLKIIQSRISNEKFLKIRRGLVVNKLYISSINLNSSCPFVELINGRIFPISRRLQVEIKNKIAV